LRQIAHARRLNSLERPHPPPSVIAGDTAPLPGVVECGFQDSENAVCGRAPLANPVGALVHLPVVGRATGSAARRGTFCPIASIDGSRVRIVLAELVSCAA
jgi:hypothetical protein